LKGVGETTIRQKDVVKPGLDAKKPLIVLKLERENKALKEQKNCSKTY